MRRKEQVRLCMIRAIGKRPHEVFIRGSGKALMMLLGCVQERVYFIVVFDRHHSSLLCNVMEMRAYLGGLVGSLFCVPSWRTVYWHSVGRIPNLTDEGLASGLTVRRASTDQQQDSVFRYMIALCAMSKMTRFKRRIFDIARSFVLWGRLSPECWSSSCHAHRLAILHRPRPQSASDRACMPSSGCPGCAGQP